MLCRRLRGLRAPVVSLMCVSVIAALPLSGQSSAQSSKTQGQSPSTNAGSVQAKQTPTKAGNHGADTRQGQRVGGGLSTGDDAAIAGGIAALAIGGVYLFHHHEHKPANVEQLSQNGPDVPKNFDMNHFVVEGFIGPGWPVALDFTLDSPGAVQLDIATADHKQYRAILTNTLNGRGIAITSPEGLPDKLQPATFDVEAIPPQGSTGPAPILRVYGMAAGPRAVGSIAIDQLTFGPSMIHLKEDAAYGFHSHSDFSSVRADFIYTTLKDNHILMKQESEDSRGPVAQGMHAEGTWNSKGTPGQHMLQIRAWRGAGGDWVVAWSPDVVLVAK